MKQLEKVTHPEPYLPSELKLVTDPEKYRNTVERIKNHCIAKKMPLQGYRTFGCMNCDFRGTSLCDYGIPRCNSANYESLNIKFNTMCEKRYWYVLSFYYGNDIAPSYKDILNCYNGTLMQDVVADLKHKLNLLDDKIFQYEEKLKTTDPYIPAYEEINSKLHETISEQNFMRDKFVDLLIAENKLMLKEHEIQQRSKDIDDFRKNVTLADLQLFMQPTTSNTKPAVIDIEEKK